MEGVRGRGEMEGGRGMGSDGKRERDGERWKEGEGGERWKKVEDEREREREGGGAGREGEIERTIHHKNSVSDIYKELRTCVLLRGGAVSLTVTVCSAGRPVRAAAPFTVSPEKEKIGLIFTCCPSRALIAIATMTSTTIRYCEFVADAPRSAVGTIIIK